MTSFQISITPGRRAAARFVARVRRQFQKALTEESRAKGLTQAEIARRIGVHRSVINRELNGRKDITLGRVGELAWALGREPAFALLEAKKDENSNQQPIVHDEQIGAGGQVKVKATDLTPTAASPAKSGNVRVIKVLEPA